MSEPNTSLCYQQVPKKRCALCYQDIETTTCRYSLRGIHTTKEQHLAVLQKGVQ